MNAVHTPTYRRAEYHGFSAGGSAFVYLVSAGAIFEIDEQVQHVLDRIGGKELSHASLVRELADQGGDLPAAEALVRELRAAQLIHLGATPLSVPEAPPADFPLQALVLNITNQCNLACTYCYEFGADKIATPAGKPKYMTIETAKASGGSVSASFLICSSQYCSSSNDCSMRSSSEPTAEPRRP